MFESQDEWFEEQESTRYHTSSFKKLDRVFCAPAQKEKDLYPSKPDADRAAKHSERKRPQDKLRSYHCKSCSGWHLTSNMALDKPKRFKKSRKAGRPMRR